MMRCLLCRVAVGFMLYLSGTRLANAQAVPTAPIRFCGYDWEVRGAGIGGPGPNQWSPKNVWLDGKGRIHLKIARTSAGWQCAELYTRQRFGFGTYEFQVTGAIDRLDRNVVLGLFDYPDSDTDPDGTNEIDIEFARWGDPMWNIGNYTVYPSTAADGKSRSHTFAFTLPGSADTAHSVHRFTRESHAVTFASFAGSDNGKEKRLAQWVDSPPNPRQLPQKPLPVHINLWLFQGKAPTDGKPVEIVIDRFRFTPRSAPR